MGTPASSCPRCGAAASGKFCASCGAPLTSQPCAACGATLAPDARFCQKCGTPTEGRPVAAGGRTAPPMASRPGTTIQTPWLVAGVLVIVSIAAIVYGARGHSTTPPAMANAGNAQGAGATPSGMGNLPVGQAPDISQMTPREQFDRLEARVTSAAQKGDSATVVNFTPMALGAYANLPPGDRDIDARYHAAMLEAQVGMFPAALALADTIMTEAPNNLLGFYVRAMVAQFQGDSAAAQAARKQFRDHFDAEMAKKRPEYVDHQPFLENYRKTDGAK